jgi:hypothetical protein
MGDVGRLDDNAPSRISMGIDLHVDYVAWAIVGAVAVACAWVLRRKSAQETIPAIWFGLASIAISLLLALAAGVRGGNLVTHLALPYSPFPGIVGYAANKTLVLGYGALAAAAIHALMRFILRSQRTRV